MLVSEGQCCRCVKQKNRTLLEQQKTAGHLRVMLESKVKCIETAEVEIEWDGQAQRYRNHAVIVCAGGELPTPLLQKMGVRFETNYGTV